MLEVPEVGDPRFDTVAGRATHKQEIVKDGPAPVMGVDTEEVLRELGIDPRSLT